MVSQPYLSATPAYPPHSEEIERGDDDSDSTDDAQWMSRLAETAVSPDAED